MGKLLWLLPLALLCGAGACTVDDTVIEDKPCYNIPGDTSCIQGYSCVCVYAECRCRRSSAQPGNFPLREAPLSLEPSAQEASLRLLQRCGALPAQALPTR